MRRGRSHAHIRVRSVFHFSIRNFLSPSLARPTDTPNPEPPYRDTRTMDEIVQNEFSIAYAATVEYEIHARGRYCYGNVPRTQARRAVRPLANVAMGRGLVTHEGHDNLDKCFFCWQPKKQLHPRFSAQTIIFSITYSTGIA